MRLMIVGAVAMAAACGAPSDRTQDAQSAATGFLAAYAVHDGAAACELMAPETRLQLEKDEQKPCEQAVLAVPLPAGTEVVRAQLYSGEGVVVLSKQAVFVSRFDMGWRVTAAGCTPRGDKPHDCEVQG